VRDLARVLWHGSATTGLPVLTIRGDFDTSFTPASDDQQTLVPVLLANQRLYGDAEPVDWRSVDLSGGAIVLNHRFQGKVNERRRAAWLERFQHERGLRLAGSVLLPLPDVDNDDRIRSIDRIELMLIPEAATQVACTAARIVAQAALAGAGAERAALLREEGSLTRLKKAIVRQEEELARLGQPSSE